MNTSLATSCEHLAGEAPLVRLLLVDDDPVYLDLCARKLRRSPDARYVIDMAGSVEEAYESCVENDYGCLLVDYSLPDGRGTDIIDKLNVQAQTDNELSGPLKSSVPPVIIVTSDSGQNSATRAIRTGAADFMSKRDVSESSLTRAISHAMEKTSLEASVKQRNIALEHANMQLEWANFELESKRRELLTFYHTVSHEVKTPLAAAREFISLVKDGAAGDICDEQQNLLELAMESCDQIKYQFTELLDLARFDCGKLRLDRQKVALSRIMERSIASIAGISRDKGIEVDVPEKHLDVRVDCDIERIVQVVSNLLTNAVKFTDHGGRVSLAFDLVQDEDRRNQRVRISVSDNGCGIPAAKLGMIFERLYQVDESDNTNNHAGLGLGLSICRELLVLHETTLEVVSEPGKGSCFSFTLPLADNDADLH